MKTAYLALIAACAAAIRYMIGYFGELSVIGLRDTRQ